MVEWDIWGSIFAYTKNRLVSWSNDKELSSGADAIDLNLFKKKEEKNTHTHTHTLSLWYW